MMLKTCCCLLKQTYTSAVSLCSHKSSPDANYAVITQLISCTVTPSSSRLFPTKTVLNSLLFRTTHTTETTTAVFVLTKSVQSQILILATTQCRSYSTGIVMAMWSAAADI